MGWGLQAMFRLPSDFEKPFFSPKYVQLLFEAVVRPAIDEQGWWLMLEVVRKMPCDEGFEPWETNDRKGFLCKCRYTRSKKVQTVSREESMASERTTALSICPTHPKI